MKYKILKSIAHNFSHSFVSDMNYVDDGFVMDDLRQLARKSNGDRIRIQWIPETEPQQAFPPRVLKSILHYRAWLPDFVCKSGASIEAIQEFRTEVYLHSSWQIRVEAYMRDNRGKEHICRVKF